MLASVKLLNLLGIKDLPRYQIFRKKIFGPTRIILNNDSSIHLFLQFMRTLKAKSLRPCYRFIYHYRRDVLSEQERRETGRVPEVGVDRNF